MNPEYFFYVNTNTKVSYFARYLHVSKTMKKYCGYSEFFHDAGIAFVMENGDIDFATHSERYTRIKNDPLMYPKLV